MVFYYFAYGTNMLAKQLHFIAPDAMRVDIGKLENYRLDFIGSSDIWRGALATVVPQQNESVWGAIWRIDMKDVSILDRNEGVDNGDYSSVEHCIVRQNGSSMMCRMYIHKLLPEKVAESIEGQRSRWPSLSYIDTLREGAKESKLPDDYVNFLYAINDNGNTTSVDHILNKSTITHV